MPYFSIGSRSPDHPRIRGEHQKTSYRVWLSCGSSPHTRGALQLVDLRVIRAGIIPAYAGSTDAVAGEDLLGQDHPRIRGEHRSAGEAAAGGPGSSPHTRGAPQARLRRKFRARIIPAYAGSTNTAPTRVPIARDHPRIRGEHSFSPTRRLSRTGIIPAYAGSTPTCPKRASRS